VAVFVSESGSPQVLVPLKMIAAVPGRASALRVVDARGCGAAHDPVRAEAPEEFDWRVPQEVSQTHHVVAGVDHDPDKWVALVPLACRDQSLDQVPHLGGGHGGEVVARSQSHGVQGRGPRGAARLQGDDPRAGPARDHQVLVLAAAVGMAERAGIAGGGVVPQPR
jgi:hypothetical protein